MILMLNHKWQGCDPGSYFNVNLTPDKNDFLTDVFHHSSIQLPAQMILLGTVHIKLKAKRMKW